MFIRAVSTRDRKTGVIYTAHQLVESIRTEKGPRQRVVMYLGTLSLPKTQWRALAAVLEERLHGQRSLFPADPAVLAAADALSALHEVRECFRHASELREARAEKVSVDLAELASSTHRSLGPELVGNAFFERLGIPEILAACGLTPYQLDLAKAVILGRLLCPGSDLATWRWMRSASSLPELVASDLEKAGKDAVYEIADTLWRHKDALELGLREREQKLFPVAETLILYDLTNTHFEGRCLGNPLAKRGVSKQKRMDCPLVTLALAVDAQGFPVFSQIYEGNQSEPATLADLLSRMAVDGGPFLASHRPTLVMDRGIATAGNLALLEREGYPYLVIERRDAAEDFEANFAQAPEGFTLVSGKDEGERVYAKKVIPVPDESEEAAASVPTALLLCFSEGRKEKERGIDAQKEKRWLEDLGRIKGSVERGALKDPAKVQRRIGRLLERYPSVASHYRIDPVLDSKGKQATGIVWERLPKRQTRETRQGCYVIRTTHVDLEAARIWKLYMMLTRVEGSFRALKSDLGFRPVRHHGEKRTKGHLFISVLAYHLLAAVERTLRGQGDTRSWATIQAQLATHQRSTIHLRGEANTLHQIRLSSTPEATHREIYRLLAIRDPLPRKRQDVVLQM
jgi:transposase